MKEYRDRERQERAARKEQSKAQQKENVRQIEETTRDSREEKVVVEIRNHMARYGKFF